MSDAAPSPSRAPEDSIPLPPGRSGLPWIGETPAFLSDPNFIAKRQARYGNIFRTHLLGRPTVVMMGQEANRYILSSHMHQFSWKEGWPGTFRELLGESLFLQEGEEHRRNRRLLMPAFHGQALESYFTTMVSISTKYLRRWQSAGTITCYPEMKELTFEIASTLLIGSESGADTRQLSQWFTELTSGLFMVPLRWSWTPYGRALKARDRLLEHLEQVIRERRDRQDRSTGAARDALGLLMESQDEQGDRLSEQELKVQALLMLFAGHETTTSMITSLVMALASQPDLQQRARREQRQLQEDGPLSMEQCRRMPYLDQILREVERVYPPVGGGFRGVKESFVFNGHRVPAGWMALYRIDATHKDETWFKHPEVFDPDRFGPDRAEHRREEFTLVGFGGGPRVCLGLAFAQLEMKIIAAQLLRHHHWELIPGQDLTMMAIPTVKPRSGAIIKLTGF